MFSYRGEKEKHHFVAHGLVFNFIKKITNVIAGAICWSKRELYEKNKTKAQKSLVWVGGGK